MSTRTATTDSTTPESMVRTRRRPWWRRPAMIAVGTSGVLLVAGLAVQWAPEAESVALTLFWVTTVLGGRMSLTTGLLLNEGRFPQ